MDEWEPNEACLRGEGFEARILAHSDAGTDGDIRWVRGEVALTLGEWTARATLEFTADELRAFADALQHVYRTLSGEAVLTTLEGVVGVRVRLADGRGTISGFLRHERGRLEFDDVPTDQSYLFDAVAGLSRITQRFPPR